MKVRNFIRDKNLWNDESLFTIFESELKKENPSIQNTMEAISTLKHMCSLDPEIEIRDKHILCKVDLEINRAIDIITKDFPSISVPIYIFGMSKDSFKIQMMNGIGGFAFQKASIIYFAPDANWQGHLSRAIVHELNHAVRIIHANPYLNFLNWLTSEGMAEVYIDERFPSEPSSKWATHVSPSDLKIFYEKLIKFDLVNGFFPNSSEWFYGSDELGIPGWFGYSLGYDMVKKYRMKNKDVLWSDFIKTDSHTLIKNY